MKKLIIFLFCVSSALCAHAETKKTPRPAENAALRYWMAFAQMNDAPLAKDTAAKLEAIVSGGADWDENRFGALIEQNKAAIETMIRGSELPYCDWGIEYQLGPDAPVAYLPKARTMSRLNVLYAKRLASQGNQDAAAKTLTAGVRFAQHLSQGASLYGALTAKVALVVHLNAIQQLVSSGHLSNENIASLGSILATLPDDGFDWEKNIRMEGVAIHKAMDMLARVDDAKSLYAEWFGEAAPAEFRAPNSEDMAAIDRVMSQYAHVVTASPERGRAELAGLNERIAKINPVSAKMIPNASRVIEARAEAIAARQKAAAALHN
jgi:hypothetical protein